MNRPSMFHETNALQSTLLLLVYTLPLDAGWIPYTTVDIRTPKATLPHNRPRAPFTVRLLFT